MSRYARLVLVAVSVMLLPFVAIGCSPSSAPALSPSSIVTPSPTPSPTPTPTPSPTPTPTFAPTPTSHGIVRDGSAAEADPVLTPGATDPRVTQANIGSTICVSGYTATVRPPTSYTSPLKRQQIIQYGDTDTKPADYEEDHLIPLEIGGAPRDPANLWPEPYAAVAADGTPAGARVKDRFENWLHDRVCSGALPLAAAQAEIAGDWVANWEAAGRP